jgi:hypothetical protein
MSPVNETPSRTERRRRGQTAVEFALTLPILLLLLFGVIEFARIFQAWVTLQNSARTAARYAVTGDWDAETVAAVIGFDTTGLEGEVLEQAVLNELVPCTDGYDNLFADHWGKDCEPGSDEDQGLRIDVARLITVVDRARIGAAGLQLKKGDRYVGITDPGSGSELDTEEVSDHESGWFHVWICSSRPAMIDPDLSQRYQPSEDRNNRLCELREGAGLGDNQYDAGGPGDAVEIIVFFNHPLITPLGLVDYVQLQARRVMINESFRTTRVVNLPPQLALPTFTPSDTPAPSNTPEPSLTPTITVTPTRTPIPLPSDTLSPTPMPECDQISITNVRFIENYVQIGIRNDNEYGAVYVSEMLMEWDDNHPLYSGMYISETRLVGNSRFWHGLLDTSPTRIKIGDPGWINDPPTYDLRRIGPMSSAVLQLRFSNGPIRLSDEFDLSMLNGSYVVVGRTLGGFSDPCFLYLPDQPTPEPPEETPTETPLPDCTQYEIDWIGFEENGVVHYRLTNTDVAVAQITGFTINWNTYGEPRPPIVLDFISVGGTNAFDPNAVVMWQRPLGYDTSGWPPAAFGVGDTGWLVTPTIPPQTVLDIWLDFDGTAGRLDWNLGYQRYDFNDTVFEIDFICDGETPNFPTPQDTNTPMPTLTPSLTYTPSDTYTPGPTRTPSNTFTPTDTFTPRPPPTNTPIPEHTLTPSNTPFGGGG